jgi:hypothetical protein
MLIRKKITPTTGAVMPISDPATTGECAENYDLRQKTP